MKLKLLITLAIAGIAGYVQAQDIKAKAVPDIVKDALMKKYPEATKVSWEKENGNYEANWGGKSGEDMSVQFTPAGQFVEQTKAITATELPDAVKSYVKSKFPHASIKEAGHMTMADGSTKYEAEVKGKDLLFDQNGNFIKVETE